MTSTDSFAEGWEKWFGMIGPAGQPVTDTLIQLAQIRPGQVVLDAATGIGEPALSVASIVGPEGFVLGTDYSSDMLKMARRRAAEREATSVRFEEMDLDRPQLAANNFHAILCRWGLMFVADLANTLAQFHRALRPGGWCAIAVLGPAEKVPALSLAAQVMARTQGKDWAEPSTFSAFALHDSDQLSRRFTDAGFSNLQGQWQPVNYLFASIGDFLAYRLDCSVDFRDHFEQLSPSEQATAKNLITEAAAPYRTADGGFLFENWTYCLAGQRLDDR
ncbi:MAG: methyltransferase domain-containing protein [Pseudomonadota bacterium]